VLTDYRALFGGLFQRAAFVCILASVAAIRLLRYARNSVGRMRGTMADGIRHIHRLRHLGDALRRDAGVHPGDSGWL
jgi:hypothetical protein